MGSASALDCRLFARCIGIPLVLLWWLLGGLGHGRISTDGRMNLLVQSLHVISLDTLLDVVTEVRLVLLGLLISQCLD